MSAKVPLPRIAFAIAHEKSKALGLVISSNVCSPICLLNPADYPQMAFGHCASDVLRKPITLDINGNIPLCNHAPVVVGNIFETNIAEMLSSEYAESWNRIISEYGQDCAWRTKCRGGCRAASEQAGFFVPLPPKSKAP